MEVFTRSIDGRLRESQTVGSSKGKEAVDQLGRSFQRTGKNAGLLGRGLTRASGGANILTRSVGSLGGVIGGLGDSNQSPARLDSSGLPAFRLRRRRWSRS